ncbi:MAG: thiolase family protein, partial [Halobacteriovoraceae bacterium]|nr:thiolase family protein [Halobacteriovoraceae bacterium]
GGFLKKIPPVELALTPSREILREKKISPDIVDQVIMANVIPSTNDTLYGGRHLALKLGMPVLTPGIVLNRLCGSGIEAVWQAKRLIQLGEAQSVLVAGAENMSLAPHLIYGGRFGTRYGALDTVDMLYDTLTDSYCQTSMGMTAENLAKNYKISRDSSDLFSFNSHKKAAHAWNQGLMKEEVVSVKGQKGELACDEHLRFDVSVEQLKKLAPTFKKDGVVTAGSASGVVDGAAAVLIASEEFCKKNGLSVLSEIMEAHVVGVEPVIMGIGAASAIKGLLKSTGKTLKQIDLLDINEAFAAQTLACISELQLDQEKLNIWGGAVAVGHPLAATGIRQILSASRQLKHRKKHSAIVSACIGGGQGIAMLLHSC